MLLEWIANPEPGQQRLLGISTVVNCAAYSGFIREKGVRSLNLKNCRFVPRKKGSDL
jgi:hypothetical protein